MNKDLQEIKDILAKTTNLSKSEQMEAIKNEQMEAIKNEQWDLIKLHIEKGNGLYYEAEILLIKAKQWDIIRLYVEKGNELCDKAKQLINNQN